MKYIGEIIETIGKEISTILSRIDENEMVTFSNALRNASRIFVTGEGRSGLMGKAFAMRLMHGGYTVYVVGETITPNIEKDDLLIAISGSGTTGMIYDFAKKAAEAGAQIGLVTTNPKSKIGDISHFILKVPAATKHRLPQEPTTIQPLGNQFDQTVHLLLDGLIIHSLQDKEDLHEAMKERHANLE
ncbi:6-phospho-3-hexuloisomerase [Anaerosolibacter sp.]|uniref:6-phospho-3-hexuloisomerase n=1 Tax=Anaerosolibacter sp. TaxID=1872527 RepID=UPI0039F0859B